MCLRVLITCYFEKHVVGRSELVFSERVSGRDLNSEVPATWVGFMDLCAHVLKVSWVHLLPCRLPRSASVAKTLLRPSCADLCSRWRNAGAFTVRPQLRWSLSPAPKDARRRSRLVCPICANPPTPPTGPQRFRTLSMELGSELSHLRFS